MSFGGTLVRTGRERVRQQFECDPATKRTKEAFKEDCDINRIMRKYAVSGVIDHLAKNVPTYGDFTTAHDYQSARNQLITAEAEFGALPSNIRKRFENDPGQFLDFMSDPENTEEAIDLGLAEARRPTDPLPKAQPPADPPSPKPGEIPPNPSPISGGE